MIVVAVVLGSLGCYALKLSGFAIPMGWFEVPWVRRATGYLPIALLGALVLVQTFAKGSAVSIDARLIGLVVAAILLAFRAPFLVVVILAAAAAAGARALGWAG